MAAVGSFHCVFIISIIVVLLDDYIVKVVLIFSCVLFIFCC